MTFQPCEREVDLLLDRPLRHIRRFGAASTCLGHILHFSHPATPLPFRYRPGCRSRQRLSCDSEGRAACLDIHLAAVEQDDEPMSDFLALCPGQLRQQLAELLCLGKAPLPAQPRGIDQTVYLLANLELEG